MIRLLVLFLSSACVASAGIWGASRGYEVAGASRDEERFVGELLASIAREHALQDRRYSMSDPLVFAYYSSSKGTLQARALDGRLVVSSIFLASERTTADSVHSRLRDSLDKRFGMRLKVAASESEKKPNKALEPTPTSVTSPADAGDAPAAGVAHL